MRLFDTHAHLDEIKEIEGALARAREAGVTSIVAVGSDLASNQKILDLARRYPDLVLPAVGLHPWRLRSDDLPANLSLIERELPRCVGLGEVGLDYAIETPPEEQEEVFKKLLALAVREKKPVLLHARRAWAEALQILKASRIEKAVFHWYSGPSKVLRELLEMGYLISATPAAATSERHRKAIAATPLDRLLLETDCPEVYQNQVSEPKDIMIALQAVSELKGVDTEELGRRTFSNALSFFSLQ